MRTIFISLSSSAVYRNLFFFPGSVFDLAKELLREKENLRIVFLIPQEHYAKYGPFFEGINRERCVAVTVTVPKPWHILARLFRNTIIFNNVTE